MLNLQGFSGMSTCVQGLLHGGNRVIEMYS